MHKDRLSALHPIIQTTSPVVFLDTARPLSRGDCSYLFLKPSAILTANRFDEIPDVLAQVERYSRTCWVVGYLSYEAAYALEPKLARYQKPDTIPGLAWFGVYDEPYVFSHRDNSWSPSLPVYEGAGDSVSTSSRITRSGIDPKTYTNVVEKIRQWIARGDTYQINFTADIEVRTGLDEFSLYRYLSNKQPTPYGAFIRNEFGSVLSFSPELFYEKTKSHIKVKPMKGTAPRGKYPEEDTAVARWLEGDSKNRAENVMIVDLMRNDLGRICRTGSVRTTKLFSVETHPTVHQMTSTVRGLLRREIGFPEIVKAIFPCGSVTGAPKIRSMEIIRELESGRRGVYCGMVGYIAPNGSSVFSVPIRTLQKEGDCRHWRYRVGSGVVCDSDPMEEWLECETKCRFLTENQPNYRLLESILLRNGSFVYRRDHLRRLRRSASFLGFVFDALHVESAMEEAQSRYTKGEWKLRLLLSRDGSTEIDCSPLGSEKDPRSFDVLIAQMPIDESEKLLYHKTDFRPWYRDAMDAICGGECYDVVFVNSFGLVTEGARSNVFARISGQLYTPPVHCGLLPGVLRSTLLRRGACEEMELTIEDLRRAEVVYCGNSVRGLVRVRLPV